MTDVLYTVFISATLAVLAFCDIRTRTVPLWLLCLYSIAVLTFCMMKMGIRDTVLNAVQSIAVMVVLCGGLMLYCSVRYHSVRHIKTLTGAGDVIFLTFTAPLFGAREFTLFLISSCIAGLLWAAVQAFIEGRNRNMQNNTEGTGKQDIPFIAASAIVLVMIMVFQLE